MRIQRIKILASMWLLLLCFHAQGDASAQATDSSWAIPLHAQIGTFEFNLSIGVRPNATAHFDVGIDTVAPPPAFTPYAVLVIPVFPNTLRVDFREPGSTITWHLHILNSAGELIRVSWNTSQLGTLGSLAMNDSLNMLAQDSAAFDGDQTLAIKYTSTAVSVTTPAVSERPELFSLRSYPNPFDNRTNAYGGGTRIEFDLPEPGFVTLEIFNILGQKVVTLLDRQIDQGRYTVKWDGRDQRNRRVIKGLYVYVFRVRGRPAQAKRMIVVD